MSHTLPRALILFVAVPVLLVTVLAGRCVEDFLPEPDSDPAASGSLAYIDLADGGDGTADVAHQQVADGYAVAWIPSGEPEPERFSDLTTARSRAEQDGAGSWGTCGTLGRD